MDDGRLKYPSSAARKESRGCWRRAAAARAIVFMYFALRCVRFASANRTPHVIQILLDDWGYGDIASLASGPGDNGGNPQPNTPSINRLVASGTLATHWHSGSPVCSPSRLALMTSRFPAEFSFHTAISGDHAANAAIGCADFLPVDTPFLPGLLTKYGNYSTAHFGKCACHARRSTLSPHAQNSAPP